MPDIRLSLAIMTAPPRSAERIMAAVSAQSTALDYSPVVVRDANRRGCWWCAQRAWASRPDSATHHIVVQDDAILGGNALAALRRIIKVWPDHPIAGGYWRSRRIAPRGRYFLRSTAGIAVLLLLPVRLLDRWLEWCERNVDPSYDLDDARLSLFCLTEGMPFVHTNPCLAQHDDAMGSLCGRELTPPVGSLLRFVAPDEDALAYDWTDVTQIETVAGGDLDSFGDSWMRQPKPL